MSGYSKYFSRRIVQELWEAESNKARQAGCRLVYDEQMAHARSICNEFWLGKSLVCFTSSPQSGKTGVSIAVTYLMTVHPDEAIQVHPDNVFIITGLSDKDWREQTKKRMLPCFRDRVYHRNDVKHMVAEVQNKRDILIIIDECHYGAGASQTIHKTMEEAGIWNVEYMRTHNIKVLCMSATPANVLLDANAWGPANQVSIVATAHSLHYTGFQHLLDEDRIIECNINNLGDRTMMLDRIVARWREPRHHIIRSSDMNSEFQELVESRNYTVCMHNCEDRMEDIDAIVKSRPECHNFIFIKSFWRCAKTLDDIFIGACYDNSTDFGCVAQGLGGRLLGYGRQRGPYAPLLFSNRVAILSYVKWLDVDRGDYLQSDRYMSTALTVVNGVIMRKTKSVMHPEHVRNVRRPRVVPAKPSFTTRVLKRIKIVPTVPLGAKVTTSFRKMTVNQFCERAKLTEMPTKARVLREVLMKRRVSVNVSYKLYVATNDANLKAYYAHKGVWNPAKFHVIHLEDSDSVTVIQRDKDMLANVMKGDKLIAHNIKDQMVLYEVMS